MNYIISIITPSLNQGGFIEQTIKSALAQQGDFYIDYIVIDGGSTDNSVEIIKKYDELLKNGEYPIRCRGIKFRWLSESDSGQSGAINKGFKMAKGDILAWLNSDDYYEPETLNIIMRAFIDNPEADLIFGDGYIVDEKGRIIKPAAAALTTYNEQLKRGCTVFQPSAFFRKKIIKQVGLLDEDLHYAMDYDLWLRIMRAGRALHIPDYLANFREWEKSKTVAHQEKFLAERKIIYKKYGGNMIDREIICRIKDKFKFINHIKARHPAIYKKCKQVIYFFVDKFSYKKNYVK